MYTAPLTTASTLPSSSVELIIAIAVPIVLLIILLLSAVGMVSLAVFAKRSKGMGDKEWIQLQKSKYEYPRTELVLLKSLGMCMNEFFFYWDRCGWLLIFFTALKSQKH